MAKSDKAIARADRLDPATWLPRREAARILNISLPTILRWEGPRFRIKATRDKRGRLAWFVCAADVERVRLERLGPTMHELESFVLSELAAGRSASEIVRSGHHVTLGDIERVRDLDARLSGGFVVDAAIAHELRQLLSVDSMTAEALLAHVRALVRRNDLMSARLNGAHLTEMPAETHGTIDEDGGPPNPRV